MTNVQHCRSGADSSHRENQLLPEVLTRDDVTSGVCQAKVDSESMRQQRECNTGTQFQPADSVSHNSAVDALMLTESASDAVGNQPASSARDVFSSWNSATTTKNAKYADHAMTGIADIGNDCREDSGGGRTAFGLEAITRNDLEFVNESHSNHRRRTDRQHHADDSVSFNLDAAIPRFVRSTSEPDADLQTTLFEDYAQSPGSRRRQRHQRRRQQFEEDIGSCWHNDKYNPSPRGASRHRRRVSDQRVSASFENLVGGLLGVPRARCSLRHLAKSVEKLSVTASGLCGRGADFPPAMAALMTTGITVAASRGRLSSLAADQPAEPVLPLRAKQAPQHVRRAKHLFKSCQSCVRGQRSDDGALT